MDAKLYFIASMPITVILSEQRFCTFPNMYSFTRFKESELSCLL